MLLPSAQHLLFLATSYDYIIVGGGTAGLTLASRLSADKSLTVGVLEAGENQLANPIVTIPGSFAQATGNSALDWVYASTPQEHANNRNITYAGGKMLGGSSSMGAMLWNVGSSFEYDRWESIGNPGWNGQRIMKAIRKSEKYVPPTLQSQLDILPKSPVDKKNHGSGGPVVTSFGKWFPQPAARNFLTSLESMGIGWNTDPYRGDATGGMQGLSTINPAHSTRVDSNSAYLLPNINRTNLVVLTGTTVSRILLAHSAKGKRAMGIEFVAQDGTTHIVHLKSNGEVVLSAGTVQTPQLLELSGIGKKEVLEAAGIDVVVLNENVGEGLQDHIFTPQVFELSGGIKTPDTMRTDAGFAATQKAEYASNGTGTLSGSMVPLAFLPLTKITTPAELASIIAKNPKDTVDAFTEFALPVSYKHPDANKVAQVEIIFAPYKLTSDPHPSLGKSYLSLAPTLMHPISRGSIHITTNSPFEKPLINPNFYSNPTDRAVIIAGMRFTAKLATTDPLSTNIAARVEPPVGEFELTDEEWFEYIKNTSESAKDPVGTAAMRPRDEGGVVDPKLRVYGVRGLRIVDASIMPTIISAHTQATVYGIAEMAAELILEDRQKGWYN